MPRVQDILDELNKAKYFSTLDLFAGYYQLLMHPDSKKCTAFATRDSLYMYNKMPMGLKNSGSTLQRTMNDLFDGINYKILFCYVDDAIVFSETIDEHITRLNLVFDRLEAGNFRLKYEKCYFLQTEVEFLGFHVSGEGVKANPKKVLVIKDYPRPTSPKDIKVFI